MSDSFFDAYPEFYASGRTNPYPNRLKQRYHALIENHKNLIRGKRILDLASHDGRWSFAALKAGAAHVLAIEMDPPLVQVTREIFKKYDLPESSYQLIEGDAHEEIKKVSPGTIDTVFCFGFFYHTMYHLELLAEIKRINPQHLVLDCDVVTGPRSVILVRREGVFLTGIPSRSAVELMLAYFGFSFDYYDWRNANISDWSHIGDYQNGSRITLAAHLDSC